MENESKTFDGDYVKELRQEAAGYRTQLRDLESQVKSYQRLEGEITQLKIENELVRRGINVEPDWIKVKGDQPIGEAVDSFLEKYPQFLPQAHQSEELTPHRAEVPNAIVPPQGKANVPGSPRMHKLLGGDRTLQEIESDPVARQDIARIYQAGLPFNQPE